MSKFIHYLTISRMLAGPFIFILVIFTHHYGLALIAFLAASITDYLDGFFARKNRVVAHHSIVSFPKVLGYGLIVKLCSYRISIDGSYLIACVFGGFCFGILCQFFGCFFGILRTVDDKSTIGKVGTIGFCEAISPFPSEPGKEIFLETSCRSSLSFFVKTLHRGDSIVHQQSGVKRYKFRDRDFGIAYILLQKSVDTSVVAIEKGISVVGDGFVIEGDV